MKPDETRDRLRQVRSVPTRFETREDDNGQLVISGYFSVFNSIYEIGPGMSESVAPGTFLSSLNGDVRALTNHDSTLVLGRTTAGTLKLREDDVGLWGDVIINPKDSDAVNTYERVKRGDVSQCSFGFRITQEDTEVKDDGSVHWTIRDVDLYEVSVCTFPAYEDTGVSARAAELETEKRKQSEKWRADMIARVKGA